MTRFQALAGVDLDTLSDEELGALATKLYPDTDGAPLRSMSALHSWLRAFHLSWSWDFTGKGLGFNVVSKADSLCITGRDVDWDPEIDIAYGTHRSRALALHTTLKLLQRIP
jgi:hypothetical protein